jgi:hypothetical protein
MADHLLMARAVLPAWATGRVADSVAGAIIVVVIIAVWAVAKAVRDRAARDKAAADRPNPADRARVTAKVTKVTKDQDWCKARYRVMETKIWVAPIGVAPRFVFMAGRFCLVSEGRSFNIFDVAIGALMV